MSTDASRYKIEFSLIEMLKYFEKDPEARFQYHSKQWGRMIITKPIQLAESSGWRVRDVLLPIFTKQLYYKEQPIEFYEGLYKALYEDGENVCTFESRLDVFSRNDEYYACYEPVRVDYLRALKDTVFTRTY